jgi:hypothetical protein
MEHIPYIVHESDMIRQERTIKRLWILCMLLVIMLVTTNLGWLYYETSFENIVVTQDNENGYNNFIGNDGNINYGETNNKD